MRKTLATLVAAAALIVGLPAIANASDPATTCSDPAACAGCSDPATARDCLPPCADPALCTAPVPVATCPDPVLSCDPALGHLTSVAATHRLRHHFRHPRHHR